MESTQSKEQLTLFAADSLNFARTSATQVNAPASRANGLDSGLNTPDLLAKYDPNTSSWKTSQLCLDGDYQEFSETWPRSGMTRSGTAYRLPTLAHRITETGYGFWPTPDTRGFVNEGSVQMLSKMCDSWEEYSSMAYRAAGNKKRKYWPTPQAPDNRDRGNLSSGAVARRMEKGKQISLSQSVSDISGQLNPTWVEGLMGFPIGWTDIAEGE